MHNHFASHMGKHRSALINILYCRVVSNQLLLDIVMKNIDEQDVDLLLSSLDACLIAMLNLSDYWMEYGHHLQTVVFFTSTTWFYVPVTTCSFAGQF